MAPTETRPATRAWIGLGSNLEQPQLQVERALAALAVLPDSFLVRHSHLYRTAPWGIANQPAFVNAVAEIATALRPRALLDALLAIERAQGRHRDEARWGPRTLDLDLLLYGDARFSEAGLTVPHPRIAERAFVMIPLAELDPDRVIPGLGAVGALLAKLEAGECVPIH